MSRAKNKERITIRYYSGLVYSSLIFTERELACNLDDNEIIDEVKNYISIKRRLALYICETF